MFERIIEIIMFVVGELKVNKSISNFEIDKLLLDGYSKSEISTAFSWLADRFEFSNLVEESAEELVPYSNKSFRIFHQAELELFTTEAVKNIFQLSSMDLISIEQIERLIEQAAFMSYGKMDDASVKREVAGDMIRGNSYLPAGYRFTLLGNESIN